MSCYNQKLIPAALKSDTIESLSSKFLEDGSDISKKLLSRLKLRFDERLDSEMMLLLKFERSQSSRSPPLLWLKRLYRCELETETDS